MSKPAADQKPIVVGIDGSTGAQHALRWALREASIRGTSLRVVHAWTGPTPISGIGSILFPVDPAPYESAAKQLLEESIERELARVGDSSVIVVPTLTRRGPAAGLLEAGKDAQLLVVGTRKRTLTWGIARLGESAMRDPHNHSYRRRPRGGPGLR